MTGMILAAGRGTRLAPITDTIPKALVEVGGRPMLYRVAERMVEAGVRRLVINIHALGETILDALEREPIEGAEVIISDERNELLDTGGGLLKARTHLESSDGPFLLHNVDIITDIDLVALRTASIEADATASLAVMERPSTRALLFDSFGLYGFVDDGKGIRTIVREPSGETIRLGFCGVHAISPTIFSSISESGEFPIIPLYLRLAGEGKRIVGHRVDGSEWWDIGTPERLERVRSL